MRVQSSGGLGVRGVRGVRGVFPKSQRKTKWLNEPPIHCIRVPVF
jgi:hypothetical protein